MCKKPFDGATAPPSKGGKPPLSLGAEEAALPWQPIAALSMCNAAHFYSLCSIFSYAAFLCVDAGWVDHIDEAGFMAGLLPTAVMAGRILTSFAWGLLSDRIGRRRCLELSMLAVAAGNLLFGFSTWLWAALTVRFVVLGMLNGWVAHIGPLSQEIGGAERQSEVLSLVFASGPLIQMLGPALGGLLYGTLGTRFPALPPSLVGAVLALLAATLVNRWLPPPAARGVAASERAAVELTVVGEADDGPTPAGGTSTRERAKRLRAAGGEDAAPLSAAEGEDAAAAATAKDGGEEASARPPRLCAMLWSHPLPLVMLVRSGTGGLLFGQFDVVPLWLAASRGVGGMAMDEKTLGGVLACSSLVMLPWSLGPMGRFIKRRGVRGAMRAGLLAAALAYSALVPAALALDAVTPALGVAACVLLNSVANMAAGTAGTASFAATNNAARRFPACAGAITGVHVTAEAIGKLLGPALGAPLLGALLAALRPPHGHAEALQLNGPVVTMLAFGGASLLCFAGTLALPRVVDGPQRSALLHGKSGRSDAPQPRSEEKARVISDAV